MNVKSDRFIIDENYKKIPQKKEPRLLQFDSTLNFGHLLIVITTIGCSIGAWYDLKSSVTLQQVQITANAVRVEKVNQDSEDRSKIIQQSIVENQKDQRQELSKMRDDMNTWFMKLNDKLDTKADKRG